MLLMLARKTPTLDRTGQLSALLQQLTFSSLPDSDQSDQLDKGELPSLMASFGLFPTFRLAQIVCVFARGQRGRERESKAKNNSNKTSKFPPPRSSSVAKMPDETSVPAANLPWVEKYRPSDLDGLISHEDIVATIRRFMREDKLPHLLFYGPPGTGKTSTILACARELYPDRAVNSMVLELNASDDRGINVVRGPILNFASTRTIFNSGFKLVILDEADAMTQDAQVTDKNLHFFAKKKKRGKKKMGVSMCTYN